MPSKPRRQRGEGSVFQREDGQYVGQLDLGWVNGKRRRKTVYGRTSAEVVRKIGEVRRQLAERGDLPTADITVAKWLAYWLEEIAAKRVKPSTLASYRVAVGQYLTPSIGRHRLSRLAAQHVREMHRHIAAKGRSSTTALNAHRCLSAALNDAVRDGRVARNVAALVRAPSKAVSTRTGLAHPDAVRVLATARTDERLGSRWMAAFLLGLRQGERLGLRWSYLDLDNGIADVSWSLQRVGWAHGCALTCGRGARACPARFLPIPDGMEHVRLGGEQLVLLRPKTRGSQRLLPIVEPLRLALLDRQALAETERPGYTVDHDLVWCREDGRPLHPRDDWEDWCSLLDETKVARVTLHEARHTTATLLLEAGVDPHVVQQILGHSNVLTTRGYQHVSLALSRAALDGLSERLALG